MEHLLHLAEILRHLPEHISHWTEVLGIWVYGLLFVIIFAETGLVIAPLLPGDSLLFAAGALTAADGPLSLPLLLIVLTLAAITGDFFNFTVGRTLGTRWLRTSGLINPKYLERAEAFYKKYGGQAVILARFLPIIRTYAPFVAGLSGMARRRYLLLNICGAALWMSLFLLAGHWFGNLPFVKSRFEFVVLAIMFVTVLPAAVEFWRARQRPMANRFRDNLMKSKS